MFFKLTAEVLYFPETRSLLFLSENSAFQFVLYSYFHFSNNYQVNLNT